MHRILFFPRRRLHFVEPGAHDHFYLVTAQTARRPATIHRRVASAQHDDPLADAGDMSERYRRQPIDADMDVRRGFDAARNGQIAPARRAAADEHRIPSAFEQRAHAVDPLSGAELDPHVQHVAHFLVDDSVGQAELGNLRAHHAAGLGVAVEHHAFVAERREIARDRQRRRSRADQRDALAVLGGRRLGQARPDVFLEIGGDALQPADRDRLRLRLVLAMLGRTFLDADTAARGLARPIAGAAENARKHIRFPVDEIRVAIAAGGDQPNVFGNWGMGRTGPLTIDDFMEIVGMRDIRRLQCRCSPMACPVVFS